MRGQDKLCFPATVWYGSLSGPTVQNFKLKFRDSGGVGAIWPDDDWRGAFRYVFGNGTTTPDVVVQGIRLNNSNLYVYIEANNLPSLAQVPTGCSVPPLPTPCEDTHTKVMLIFNQGTTYQMITYNPLANLNPTVATDPLALVGGNAGTYEYREGTCCNGAGQVQWPTPFSTPNWLQQPAYQVGFLQYAGTYHWYLEANLPISSDHTKGVFIPTTTGSTFPFYIVVLRVVNGVYEETWWPTTPQAYENGCDQVAVTGCSPSSTLQVPAPTSWGSSTVDPMQSCGGVSVGSQLNDIYTDNQPNSKIDYTKPPAPNTIANVFHAYLQNTSKDASGNDIPANQVTATFKIENWGMPPAYKLWAPPNTENGGPGIGNNPTLFKDIPATVCANPGPPTSTTDHRCILSTGPWILTPTQITDYSANNMAHQCILVQLDSAPYTTKISSLSLSATGTVTVVTSGNNPFNAGQKVTIALVPNNTFNGSFLISQVDSPTQFEYCLVPNPPGCPNPTAAASSSGGTATGGVAGNTVFLNNTAVQNMDFVGASKFERVAEISAKGYPPRPDNPDGSHNPGQLFELHVISSQEVLKSGQTSTNYAASQGGPNREPEKGRVVSQLTWVLNGCRHTGRFMLVDDPGNERKENHKIELCDPVGAFGYVIRHRGKSKVKDWNLQFTGPNLTPVPVQPGTYQILIPQDGVATVTTHAEPQEQGIPGGAKVGVFLDAGAGIPHGTFSNAFNTGFSLNTGLEYIATSHFSVEGIFGYHRFPAKTVGGVTGTALNLYQFSSNAKFYLTNGGPFRPFVNGGIGGYDFTPGGGTHFGGNVGAGVLREFGPHWGLQASYNFHTVNTPVAATKFSTLQGGIRFVF